MLGGANSLTQWYCPPELGALRKVKVSHRLLSPSSMNTYIDAISAKDAVTRRVNIQVMRYNQTVPCRFVVSRHRDFEGKDTTYSSTAVEQRERASTVFD